MSDVPGKGAAQPHSCDLTPETVCEALHDLSIACVPQDIRIEARDDRCAVYLPGGRMAWYPTSAHGSRQLAAERRVLALLAERCSFRVPRLLATTASGFDIREMVLGLCNPWELFQRCNSDRRLAKSIGRSLGGILAEQHASFIQDDVAAWLPWRAAWPLDGAWIEERLVRVVHDRALRAAMADVVAHCEALPVSTADCALIHGDVGLHNLALDPQNDAVTGIFDYHSAAWADRHHDFRNLLFDMGRDDMLEAALDVYEPALGRALDRGRIALYNAACAVSFVAFRDGTPPEAKSCGRTLAEDLAWVREALSRLG